MITNTFYLPAVSSPLPIFYKIQNNLTPAYMKDPLPPSKNNRYGTRSEHVLQEFKCNSVSYIGSFYPDSVKCWNRVGHLYRNSPNLKSFKAKLVASYRPTPKSNFGIFNPISVQRLFQLHVGLSPLLEHKNNHNFLDTPSNICTTCNSPENLEHFIVYCMCFIEFRLNLLNTIILLNRNLLEDGCYR